MVHVKERRPTGASLPIISLILLILGQGCLLSPVQVELDSTLGEGPLMAIQEEKPCDYSIALDEESSRYTVTKYPDTWTGGQQQYTFPLGKNLSSYMSQAQKANTVEPIRLQFQTSKFHFILGENYTASVNLVSYHAHFIGPKPIGHVRIRETYALSPEAAREIEFPEKTFYAVSQALRSTTVKLFREVGVRICQG